MMRFFSLLEKLTAATTASTFVFVTALANAQPGLASAPFDHSKTGFVLRDVHTTLRCEQCHVDGIFKNTPKNCADCHSVGSRIAATPKPVNHVQTTNSCDTCHVSATSFLVKSFKHNGVSTGCASCHNGQSLGVTSKPANHFPTLLPCENCHTNTNTFTSWRMDHTGLTSGCASCHRGQFLGVVSQPSGHIPTSGADCSSCHNTATFLGATYVHNPVPATCLTCHNGGYPGVVTQSASHIPTAGADCGTCHNQTNTSNFSTFLGATYSHSPAPATCAACHNGVNAMGKVATHLPTTADCSTCHTATNTGNYTSFLGATYTHSPVPTTCASCHNGVIATGKPASHITTTLDCGNSSCHTQTNTANFTTFAGASFVHSTIAPGTACSSCHNGVIATGQSTGHVATRADCGTCHTASNTANYTTFLGATYVHNPNPPTAGSCPTCHNGTTATGKPSGHIATTASCDACHTGANTSNYTTFLGASGVDHSTIAAGTCASCHNGATAIGQTPGHIPTGTLSCDGCHQKYNGTTVLTFAPGTMNHALVTSSRCDTCHNGSYTTQGLQYGGAQAKVSNHIPTTITGSLDCTTCHTPTYTSASGWLAEKMNHNGAMGGGTPVYCVSCHLTGVTYLGNMTKKSHNGASTAKDCSNSSCHKPLGKTGSTYSSWGG